MEALLFFAASQVPWSTISTLATLLSVLVTAWMANKRRNEIAAEHKTALKESRDGGGN